jgi:hypothetical protein
VPLMVVLRACGLGAREALAIAVLVGLKAGLELGTVRRRKVRLGAKY